MIAKINSISSGNFSKMFANCPATFEGLVAKLPEHLRQWAERGERFWVFRHPLHYSVPFFGGDGEVDSIVANILAKERGIVTAMEEKRWGRVVWLHERPHRFSALLELAKARALWSRDAEPFLATIGNVWIDSENVWQNLKGWKALFSELDPSEARAVMRPNDREWLREMLGLGDTIEVYRGAVPSHEESNGWGLSWTTDPGKAYWFARRFASSTGKVFRIEIPLSEIFAVFTGRNENEVVPRPAFLERAKPQVVKVA